MKRNKILIITALSLLLISSSAFAEGFLYRYQLNGVERQSSADGVLPVTWGSFFGNMDWNNFNISKFGIKELPTEDYPVSNPTGNLDFNTQNEDGTYNKIDSIDQLKSIQSVGGYLDLWRLDLTNIDGLKNLESVGSWFHISNNKLTNVDGLSSLTSVGGNFSLKDNPSLENIEGASNIKVGDFIEIDDTYDGPKLSSDSTFCSQNDESQFILAPKTQVCEA